MVVENNKIEKLFIEPGKADNVAFDYDPWEATTTANIMKYLRSVGRTQEPPDESRWYFKVPHPEVDTSQLSVHDDEGSQERVSAEEEWIRFQEENEEFQDFNPETDSIYHKEMEEKAKQLQKNADDEMESTMLGS